MSCGYSFSTHSLQANLELNYKQTVKTAFRIFNKLIEGEFGACKVIKTIALVAIHAAFAVHLFNTSTTNVFWVVNGDKMRDGILGFQGREKEGMLVLVGCRHQSSSNK